MSDTEAVFMVVQEAPDELPSTVFVVAQSQESAVARVPELAKDFFGEVPLQLRTWRISWEDDPRAWRIYETVWSSENGEVLVEPAAVPGPVVVLLASYAGKIDGISHVLDAERLLCDVNGGEVFFDVSFPQGCGDVTKAARTLYAKHYSAGVNEAVQMNHAQRMSKGGSS